MKPTILIVEDNEMMLTFLDSYLSAKYRVITKNNGLSALSWLESGNLVDLIISDVNMPDLSGFEMLEGIRSSSFHKKIPVIMLSAKEKSQDRIRSLKLGANDYITKPFNPEELEVLIEKNLSLFA